MAAAGIRLILFFMSHAGYGVWMKHNFQKINIYFIPSAVIALQSVLLFISGILNCLYAAAVCLFLGGLFLGLCSLWQLMKGKQFSQKIRELFQWKEIPKGYLWFLCAAAVLLIAVKGHVLAHYDEFSHWGLAVQDMLLTDRFPNFERSRIGFQDYPLGASSYVYYVSRVVSSAETLWMFAQAYMEICFILPVFAFMGKANQLLYVCFISAAANIVLCMNIPVTSLLVDTVLPLEGAAAFLWVFYYHTKNRERGAEFYAILAAYLHLAVQIKNSGIFFVLISGGYLLYVCARNKCGGFRNAGITLLAPLLSLFIWKKHCAYVYSGSAVSKHAMTLENYIRQYASKSGEDINRIFSDAAVRILQQKAVYAFLFFAVVLYGYLFIVYRDKFRKIKHLAVCSGLAFVFYTLGIAGMYIFSMPNGIESQGLYGFERYFLTIICFLTVINLVPAAEIMTQTESCSLKNVCICFAGMLMMGMLMTGTGSVKTVFNSAYNEMPRRLFENTVAQYHVSKGKSYLIAAPEEINMNFALVARYSMVSDNVKCIHDGADMSDAGAYSYIILLGDENKQTASWIEENYPKQAGRHVVDADYDLWMVKDEPAGFRNEYGRIRERLRNIREFSEYLKEINNDDYIVFLSVKTEGTEKLSDEEAAGLKGLGIDASGVQGKFGVSMYAVVNGREVLSEQEEGVLKKTGRVDDEKLDYKITSAGIRWGDLSSIVLNGREFSLNQRGFNIAVYSRKFDALIDSVTFDTYAGAGAYRQL